MRQLHILRQTLCIVIGSGLALAGSSAWGLEADINISPKDFLNKVLKGEVSDAQLREQQSHFCRSQDYQKKVACDILSPILWLGASHQKARDAAARKNFGEGYLTETLRNAMIVARAEKPTGTVANQQAAQVPEINDEPSPSVTLTRSLAPQSRNPAPAKPKAAAPTQLPTADAIFERPWEPTPAAGSARQASHQAPVATVPQPAQTLRANPPAQVASQSVVQPAVPTFPAPAESSLFASNFDESSGQREGGEPALTRQAFAAAPQQGQAPTEECAQITNKKIGESSNYATCISVCGDKKLVYIERRTNDGMSSRFALLPVNTSIDSALASSVVGGKLNEDLGISCNIHDPRAAFRYARQFHSSLKAGIKCENGNIVANHQSPTGTSQLRLPELQPTLFRGKLAEKELSCSITSTDDEDNQSFAPEIKLTMNKAGIYKGTFSGFEGAVFCEGKSDSVKTIANEVWMRDAKTCNFNKSGLARNKGADEGSRWETDNSKWVASLQIQQAKSDIATANYKCELPGQVRSGGRVTFIGPGITIDVPNPDTCKRRGGLLRQPTGGEDDSLTSAE